jgi:tight adherence protein B
MTWDIILMLYAGAFLGVLLLIEGAAQLLGLRVNKAEEAINRRLRLLVSGADSEEVLQLLRKDRKKKGVFQLPLLGNVRTAFEQSGLEMKESVYWATSVAVGCLVLALMYLRTDIWVAFGGGLVIGLVIPTIILMVLRAKRVQQLTEQLPDAIDLIVRSLRAGHPLSTSFQTIAQQMPDPIGSQMGIVSDEITYGEELSNAIRSLADRSGSEDYHYLAVAISIQHGTGGNLAAVLNTLSQVIRDRFTMKRKIRAVSAEGRITAYVVTAVPLVLVVFLLAFMPEYYTEVTHDPLFWPFMYTGLGFAIANGIVLNKLVKFRI